MGIVRFALRFPHTFYVLAALMVFLGVISVRQMPTDIFPEINIPVVTVIWSYTGLSTPESSFSSVVLPHPLGPRRPVSDPGAMLTLTSLSAKSSCRGRPLGRPEPECE